MTTKNDPVLICEREAARLCGISRTAWRTYVDAGKTPAPIRLGRRILWLRDEIIAWCKAGCPIREKWNIMKNTLVFL